MALNCKQAYEFLSRSNRTVISTTTAQGLPEAALINYGVTRDLELVFETLQTSRKYANLMRDPHAALVMGFESECRTCQYEGIVDRPDASELPALLRIYFKARPEARGHRDWPDLVYLRVRPTWLRISSYGPGLDWEVDELTFPFRAPLALAGA